MLRCLRASGCPLTSPEPNPCLQTSAQPQRLAQTHDANDCDRRDASAGHNQAARAPAAASAVTAEADAEFADWGSSSFGFDPPTMSRPGTRRNTGILSDSCAVPKPSSEVHFTDTCHHIIAAGAPSKGRPGRQQPPPPDGRVRGGQGSPSLLAPLQRGFKALIDGEAYVSERERTANKGLGIDAEQPLSPEPSLLNKVAKRYLICI
jgi:hypothetical protein